MARLLGIDATKTTVRAALIRTSYRRVTLEAFGEADVGWAGSETEAIKAAVGGARPDACATALSGERSFYRRIELPAAAQKEIENVLAFELEATVPFEMEEAIFDYRVMKGSGGEILPVFAALARIDDVRGRLTPVREAIGIEPERVGTGPLPLANLVSVMPELERPQVPGPIAIVDIGDVSSEIVILLGGDPVFARTLSRGTAGFPASAPALERELRQTFASWRSQGGDPLVCLYLCGPAASAENAHEFLSEGLGVSVLPLPPARIEGMTPDQAAQVPRFAKALGLALGLAGRSRAPNLRRGVLEAERSYPFLREKIPLLSGLAAVIFVSFGFSTVAEMRALDAERETLVARLGVATRDVLGEEITEPEKAKETIEAGPAKADEDPLPHIDAFDVMVQLSKAVPKEIVHDVVELDVQRGKAVIQGVVPTVGDAETIAKNLKEHRCFKDVKIARTSQYTEGKQKYQLELELKCEPPKKKATTPEAEGSAPPAASGKAEKVDGGR
ncbi:General secretion pathway protein L [Minicystis rosea]|nr:General secretion pathway protein L [Minicystis rosea]